MLPISPCLSIKTVGIINLKRSTCLFAVSTCTATLLLAPMLVATLFLGGCIHDVARDGNIGAAKFCLDLGADIDSHESFGTVDTPLIIAARNKHPEMVRYLISRGADVNRQGEA